MLAGSDDQITSLDHATRGDRSAGPRYREIMAPLSANTVQEHLTAVFDKVGVRSRRELAATLLTSRH